MHAIAPSQTSDTWSVTRKFVRSSEICKLGWRSCLLPCDQARKCRPSWNGKSQSTVLML